jgi:Uma2 family endonuclease
MTTAITPAAQHIVLEGVSWDYYQATLREVAARHIFVTYDRGRLELMAPSFNHDRKARILFQVVTMIAEVLNVPLVSGGTTTLQRQDLDQGLEPDECFWLKNEKAVREKEEIDLAIDPPPDLAIEVEISRRLAGRREIYAAMGVPELWRYDGRRLTVFQLDANKSYQQAQKSLWFPTIPFDQIERFVEMSRTMDQTAWARTVRKWLAQNIPHP